MSCSNGVGFGGRCCFDLYINRVLWIDSNIRSLKLPIWSCSDSDVLGERILAIPVYPETIGLMLDSCKIISSKASANFEEGVEHLGIRTYKGKSVLSPRGGSGNSCFYGCLCCWLADHT
jgi:hypothetical protein